MIWITCGAVAIVLILAFWVRMWASRRRRVREVRHIVETLFSSVSARRRLLKALRYYHDLWRPCWTQSRKVDTFTKSFKQALERFEVSPDDQDRGLWALVEIAIPDNTWSDKVNNLRLRRELRIVIDAVEQTLVIEAPEAEPERHYREERVN